MRSGAVLSYASIAVKLVVSLLYTPFLIRSLGASEYGIYSLAASIVSYLTVLDLGFGNAIIRYTAKFRAEGKTKEQEELLGTFLGLYMIIGVFTLLLGSGIVALTDSVFGQSMTPTEVYRTKIVLVLMIVNISFTFPMSLWGSVMSAYERFVFPKIVAIVRTILNAIVMVALLRLGYKAVAMVVVTTVFNFLTLFLNFIYCKVNFHLKVRFVKIDTLFLKEILTYSFWIFLNVLMDKAYWSTGNIVLGAFSGTGAVSEFGVAFQLVSYYMLMTVAVSNLVLPRFTVMVVNESEECISDFFIKVSRLQYYLCILIVAGFIVFGKTFVVYWAGPQYSISYYLALIIMLPMTIDVIFSSAVKVLQARNQMQYRSIVCIVSAVISLVLQIPAARFGGSMGVALTVAIVFLCQIIVLSFYYQRTQHLDIVSLFKSLSKQTVIPIILVLSFILIMKYTEFSIMSYILYALLFISIYVVSSWLFVMNDYEKGMVLQFKNKLVSRS